MHLTLVKFPFRILAVMCGLAPLVSGCGQTYAPPAELASRALASDVQALSSDVQSLKNEQGLLFEQLEELRLMREEGPMSQSGDAPPSVDAMHRFDERVHALGQRLEATKQQQGTSIEHLRADLGKLKIGVETLAKALSNSSDAALSSGHVLAGDAYIVRPGDTLEKISKRLRVSVDALRQCNHLKGDLIVSGQKLRVPKIDPEA